MIMPMARVTRMTILTGRVTRMITRMITHTIIHVIILPPTQGIKRIELTLANEGAVRRFFVFQPLQRIRPCLTHL